ncbi:MAG: RICIN domain-containing protein, partial [Pseudomonadales bacterium]|nr:RICIN domain-containing protein [Pseudomonadales bacterium]
VDIDNLIYVPRTPETRASNLSVTDNNVFAIIDADLSFDTATNQEDIEFYFLRYADENGCPIAGEPVETYLASDAVSISDSLYMDYPPNNATNLLLVSGNQDGEHAEADCANYISAPEGTWNQIDYNQPARFAPAAVTVTDIDPSLSLNLEIVVEPSQYELDIRHYSVYLGSGAGCTLLGQLPKGGGTLSHPLSHEEYLVTESSPFFPDWVSYPNQIITVVSDGENCFQDPKLSRTYQEDSGVWHLIYLVEGEETSEINSHYNSIRIPYDPAINPAWDATCMSLDGDNLVTAPCNKDDGKQRFIVRSAENPENVHQHVIESLFSQKCFQRTSAEGENDWLLADCDESSAQQMELRSNGVDLFNKKIAVNRNATEQSCATATDGRDDVYGTWNNCDATSGIYWQFWQQAMPSDRQCFEE